MGEAYPDVCRVDRPAWAHGTRPQLPGVRTRPLDTPGPCTASANGAGRAQRTPAPEPSAARAGSSEGQRPSGQGLARAGLTDLAQPGRCSWGRRVKRCRGLRSIPLEGQPEGAGRRPEGQGIVTRMGQDTPAGRGLVERRGGRRAPGSDRNRARPVARPQDGRRVAAPYPGNSSSKTTSTSPPRTNP